MRQTKPHRFLQSAVHSLLGAAAILLLTYAGYRLHLDLATTAFACLIVVVLGHPPPPMAQAPKPTGVMSSPLDPNGRVGNMPLIPHSS